MTPSATGDNAPASTTFDSAGAPNTAIESPSGGSNAAATTSASGSRSIRNETLLQTLMRVMYPMIRKVNAWGGKGTVLQNRDKVSPPSSFYALSADLNTGETLDFAGFKGKKVLVVNTASDCGFTGQYAEMQTLHERFGDRLHIIAFPANDFAHQEARADADIAQFCRRNYGVTFPVARKSVVVKRDEQHAVFRWLTHAELNGWNAHASDWNFGKFIISEEGVLSHYFGPAVSPLSDQFLNALNQG
jgi:glutathione peroxidase